MSAPEPVLADGAELHTDHQVEGYELLRQMRKTPTVLYGIFVEIVRRFYENKDNFPMGVTDCVWDADPTKSQIWIDTELQWEDENPTKRPAIFVKLGPIQYKSLTGRSDAFLGVTGTGNQLNYSRSGTGSVSFVHIGATNGSACSLADATQDLIDAYGGVIRDDFCFTRLWLEQREPLAAHPKESKERYRSVVTVNFEFQDVWTIIWEAPLLKQLTLRARQALLSGGIFQ